jgi:hypothetical protein
VALGAPFVAGVLARGTPLVPAALAAFAAYVVHAAVDWDWEMGAVTLAALAIAAALLAAADARESLPFLSPRLRAGGVLAALLLAVVAFVGVVGSSALAAGDRAFAKRRLRGSALPGAEVERLVVVVARPVAAARRHRR